MQLNKKTWILFIGIALILPTLAYAGFDWYSKKYRQLPYYASNATIQYKGPYYTVPNYRFINQDSVTIDENYTKKKIWVAHYFFTACPSICPKMMSSMRELQIEFGDENAVRFLSFTVDPERDQPSILKKYAAYRNIDTHTWQLLTGPKPELYKYARKGLGLVATDGDGGVDDFIHSDKLVLIDTQNHIRGFYDGTSSADIQLLKNDIHRLLNN